MKLIRYIPRDADLLASIHGLFGCEFVHYKYKGLKYLKIILPGGKCKCYVGDDSF